MIGSVSGERSAAIRHAQRASGQVVGLAAMIAASRPFPHVAQQLLAARGSLDSLLVRLVDLEVRDCVADGEARDAIDGLLRVALGRSATSRIGIRARRRPASPSLQVALTERTTSP